MAPLIISGVASLANTVLDKVHRAKEPHAAAPATGKVEFDSLLKNAPSLSGAPTIVPSQMSTASAALMRNLLQTSEVTAALNGQQLPVGSELQFANDGGLAIRHANGWTQPICLAPETQALARQVRESLASG